MSEQRLRDLITRWREKEQRLCLQADGQGQTQYAERLAAKADGVGTCADALEAVLAASDVPPQETRTNVDDELVVCVIPEDGRYVAQVEGGRPYEYSYGSTRMEALTRLCEVLQAETTPTSSSADARSEGPTTEPEAPTKSVGTLNTVYPQVLPPAAPGAEAGDCSCAKRAEGPTCCCPVHVGYGRRCLECPKHGAFPPEAHQAEVLTVDPPRCPVCGFLMPCVEHIPPSAPGAKEATQAAIIANLLAVAETESPETPFSRFVLSRVRQLRYLQARLAVTLADPERGDA